MDSDNLTISPEASSLKSTLEQGSRQNISPAGSKEADTLGNLQRNRETIVHCLDPSRLRRLYIELGIGDIGLAEELEEPDKSEYLLEQVIRESAYSAFLKSLEGDTEHIGHRYIASLLRREEEIQASKKLAEKINSSKFEQKLEHLNIPALVPLLIQEKLMTHNELEIYNMSLHMSNITSQLRVKSLLNTKGPTAHYIFVHRCLARDHEHKSHRELYLELTGDDTPTGPAGESRKRKTAEDTPHQSTKVAKRHPTLLESPEGLTKIHEQDSRSTFEAGKMAEDRGPEAESASAEVLLQKITTSLLPETRLNLDQDQNCVICEKGISDSEKEQEAISCGGECNGWMHRVCTGLSRKLFQSAKGSSSPFLCHYCQNNAQKREIELLKTTISSLEEKLEQAESKINQGTVSEKETIGGTMSFNPLKYDKRYTMVVRGVEECESGTPKSERSTHDTKQVTATLQSVHGSLSEHAVDSCLRLGKYNPPKRRPILVRLTRSCDVSAIFSNCSKLVDRPNIVIKPVMSKEEQQVESLLLWARRQLIDTGTPGKTIRIKGNCLFVNDEKYGSVVDSEYIQSTTEITNS